MNTHVITAAALLALAAANPAYAARYILNDRDSDALWSVEDADNNGQIDDPSGIVPFFNSTNASAIPTTQNPTCLAVRADGLVLIGDQLANTAYMFKDQNNDHDALDAGEARLIVQSPNASGVTLGFPTGAAFDSAGRAFIGNAGNAFGDDAVYLLLDLNNDGESLDAGEIIEYIGDGAFGPGNGPWGPQEILFVPETLITTDSCYLRNSTTGLHGIYRAIDLNSSGRADDPGEFTTVWDATNASGIAALAGFALERDATGNTPAGGIKLYTLQTATGAVDQLIRVSDLNHDFDCQDPGEAAIVWSTAEGGFTAIDIVSRADGTVLITDASDDRIIALKDLNNDGLFDNATERTDYFLNPAGPILDIRQLSPIPPQPCPGDTNADRVIDAADLSVLLSSFGNAVTPGTGADFNGDGLVSSADLSVLLSAFGSAC